MGVLLGAPGYRYFVSISQVVPCLSDEDVHNWKERKNRRGLETTNITAGGSVQEPHSSRLTRSFILIHSGHAAAEVGRDDVQIDIFLVLENYRLVADSNPCWVLGTVTGSGDSRHTVRCLAAASILCLIMIDFLRRLLTGLGLTYRRSRR